MQLHFNRPEIWSEAFDKALDSSGGSIGGGLESRHAQLGSRFEARLEGVPKCLVSGAGPDSLDALEVSVNSRQRNRMNVDLVVEVAWRAGVSNYGSVPSCSPEFDMTAHCVEDGWNCGHIHLPSSHPRMRERTFTCACLKFSVLGEFSSTSLLPRIPHGKIKPVIDVELTTPSVCFPAFYWQCGHAHVLKSPHICLHDYFQSPVPCKSRIPGRAGL